MMPVNDGNLNFGVNYSFRNASIMVNKCHNKCLNVTASDIVYEAYDSKSS